MFLCTKDTNIHDFHERKTRFVLYDVSLHERHEYTRFPQAEDTILRSIRALKIVASTCRHRIIRTIRAMKESWRRLIDIVLFVPKNRA